MNLEESVKNIPIKFYSNKAGECEYDSPFIKGTAKNLNTALTDVANSEIRQDLYYFPDVYEVTFGRFVPAYNSRPRKGKEFLGKINVKFDIADYYKDEPHTISTLLEHPELYDDEMRYIKNKKRSEKFLSFRKKVGRKIGTGLASVIKHFTPNESVADELMFLTLLED